MNTHVIKEACVCRMDAMGWRREPVAVVVLRGRAEIQFRLEVTGLTDCTVCLVSPDATEQVIFDDAHAIMFQDQLFKSIHWRRGDVRILDEMSAMVLEDVFYEHSRPAKHQRAALTLVAHQLLDVILSSGTVREEEPGLVELVTEYFLAHLEEPVSLDALSSEFEVSKSSILKLFRSQLKKSPMKVLAEMRISKAKDLLAGSELTIAQVAASVGYSDLSTFNHFFRRNTEMSPKEFRDNHYWLL